MSLRPFRPVWLAIVALLLAPSAVSAAWTPTTPNVEGSLLAIDCSSANSCIAVGNESSGEPIPPFGGVRPLAERWDGTSWAVVPTPDLPAGGGSLNDVSCPWPTFCFAVGNSSAGLLVEVWNGTRWSIASTPAIPNSGLRAISCSGLVACTAVGQGDGGDALALRWEGAGWHVQPTPNPGGSDLNGVSCPLKRTCTAVGVSYTGPLGVQVFSPFATRWFGRVNAWGLQSAPKPDGADDASLAGVSCPIAPVCVAVGSSSVTGGPITAMAERRIGANWSLLPTPPPPGPVEVSRLQAVSCPTGALCRAVGTAQSATTFATIAERFDGTNWQLETIPLSWPQGSRPDVWDVSCPSSTFCMAVGGWSFRSSSGTLSAKWTP
jgi:hypothetical protein